MSAKHKHEPWNPKTTPSHPEWVDNIRCSTGACPYPRAVHHCVHCGAHIKLLTWPKKRGGASARWVRVRKSQLPQPVLPEPTWLGARV